MDRIIYTKPDGKVVIVTPVSKDNLEKVLGVLTTEQYENHVIERSIPSDAIKVRYLKDSDIPSNREFRDAWVDTSELSIIDIDLEKAKDIKLKELRNKRNAKLDETDKEYLKLLSKGEDTSYLIKEKQRLRDITEDLKALDVTGKINDIKLLDKIKELGEVI